MTGRILVAALLASVGAASAGATEYFVDSIDGLDARSGLSEEQAWRTLAPVHAESLGPGDVVSFRRGGVWTEGLHVDESGESGNPITFRPYGTGPSPVFEAPEDEQWGCGIRVESQSNIVIEGMLFRNSAREAIAIDDGSDSVVVRDCEFTDVGFGVFAIGSNHVVERCYFHDLHMVNNTPGGDDDYGAVGVGLQGSGHEVAWNRFERCIAPSYDYGVDGGAVEFWKTSTDCRIHHNRSEDTSGFAEIGGESGDQNHDNVIAYNLAIDCRGFGWYHMSGTFGVDLRGLRIENNTIVDESDEWTVFGFSAAPTDQTASIRNNIVWTTGDRISNYDGFVHDHNIFRVIGGGSVGFALGDGESTADPLFAGKESGDFRLDPLSPARDQGADLGYSEDLDGIAVPQGTSPDLGAFEFTTEPAADGDADANADADSGGDSGADSPFDADPDAAVEADASDVPDETGGDDGEGGCGCRISAKSPSAFGPMVILGVALALRALGRLRASAARGRSAARR